MCAWCDVTVPVETPEMHTGAVVPPDGAPVWAIACVVYGAALMLSAPLSLLMIAWLRSGG